MWIRCGAIGSLAVPASYPQSRGPVMHRLPRNDGGRRALSKVAKPVCIAPSGPVTARWVAQPATRPCLERPADEVVRGPGTRFPICTVPRRPGAGIFRATAGLVAEGLETARPSGSQVEEIRRPGGWDPRSIGFPGGWRGFPVDGGNRGLLGDALIRERAVDRLALYVNVCVCSRSGDVGDSPAR